MNNNAYHLRITEVAYDLNVCGISVVGNANEQRKRLSQDFSANFPVDESTIKKLDSDSESESCEEKRFDLLTLVEDYEGDYKDREFQRLEARFWHLYLRGERIPVKKNEDEDEVEDQEKRKSALLSRVKQLLDSFFTSRGLVKKPPDQESSGTTTTQKAETATKQPEDGKNDQHQENQRHGAQPSEPKEAKPNDGISGVYQSRFNTEKERSTQQWALLKVILKPHHLRSSSLSQFQSINGVFVLNMNLNRVLALSWKEWRSCLSSWVDLFGSTLVCYRSTLSRIHSWTELCREIRLVFQTPDYDFKLQQEIFSRMQGEHEPIDLYIAAMGGLYSRLSETTLEPLRLMGRKAESGRLRSLRMAAPYCPGVALEPDLAYYEPKRRRVVATMQAGTSAGIRGRNNWNCGHYGHRHATCRQPKRKFCYGCGQRDKIRAECDLCSPKNWQNRESSQNGLLAPRNV
ncbi:hypothetical protein J6590_106370 [Homalodisca vitripennis]|nr:hypothetical protein J6590_106370 [Homalodisca vitripennis]